MLLPFSRPACTSANVVSGGQGRSLPSSSLGQEAGRFGYFVFALMPTRSPSLMRLTPFARGGKRRRQRERQRERRHRVGGSPAYTRPPPRSVGRIAYGWEQG